MNSRQKKILIGLGVISVFLAGGYYAYVKLKPKKEKEEDNKNTDPEKEDGSETKTIN